MSQSNQLTPAQLTSFGKLTGSTETTIYTAESATFIRSLMVCENAGSTPSLTIVVHDGTNAYYKRRAIAMTAGTEAIYSEPFMLPQGWTVRLTSSALAGAVDWALTYDDPDASGRGR